MLHCERRHEARLLEDRSDPPAYLAQRPTGELGDIPTLEVHRALGGAQRGVEHSEERGLSGAGGSEHHHPLARRHLEGNAIQRGDPARATVEATADATEREAHLSSPSCTAASRSGAYAAASTLT